MDSTWLSSAVQRAHADGEWYCPCMLLRSVSLGPGEMCWPFQVVVMVISLVILSTHWRSGRGRVLRVADKRSVPDCLVHLLDSHSTIIAVVPNT